jgi:hypothetical protein
MKRHAARSADNGLKTRAMSIAVDPVTRAKFEIAARLHNQSVGDYVASAANKHLEREENEVGTLTHIDGSALTIGQLATYIASETPARQFVRMAFAARELLLSINELILLKVIMDTKELWLRDPFKHPPINSDFSEPSEPVFDYEALEKLWPQLLSESKAKRTDHRYQMGAFQARYFPKSK